MSLRSFLMALKDVPITKDTAELFVNRKREVEDLLLLLDIYKGEILGISGERGVGKTSLMNMLPVEMLSVNVVDRESKIGVVKDIIYAILRFSEERYYHTLAEKARRALSKIMHAEREAQRYRLGSILSVEFEKGREKSSAGITSAVEMLTELVEELSKRGEFVVVLDEIDKNKKEEVLLILDLIKDAFLYNSTTLLVALPAEIGKSFYSSSALGKEEANLDNVLKKVYVLKGLTPRDLELLVEKRTGIRPKEVMAEEVHEAILTYSQGNPRRYISAIKESGFQALREGSNSIKEEHVRKALLPYLKVWIDSRRLSERDKEVLSFLRNGPVKEGLHESGMSKQLFYKYLGRLKEKGLIELSGGEIYLHPYVALLKRWGLLGHL